MFQALTRLLIFCFILSSLQRKQSTDTFLAPETTNRVFFQNTMLLNNTKENGFWRLRLRQMVVGHHIWSLLRTSPRSLVDADKQIWAKGGGEQGITMGSNQVFLVFWGFWPSRKKKKTIFCLWFLMIFGFFFPSTHRSPPPRSSPWRRRPWPSAPRSARAPSPRGSSPQHLWGSSERCELRGRFEGSAHWKAAQTRGFV